MPEHITARQAAILPHHSDTLVIMLSFAVVTLGFVSHARNTQPVIQAQPRAQPVAQASATKATAGVMGALVGASACALAGAGLAGATTPAALTMLGSTGAPS